MKQHIRYTAYSFTLGEYVTYLTLLGAVALSCVYEVLTQTFENVQFCVPLHVRQLKFKLSTGS